MVCIFAASLFAYCLNALGDCIELENNLRQRPTQSNTGSLSEKNGPCRQDSNSRSKALSRCTLEKFVHVPRQGKHSMSLTKAPSITPLLSYYRNSLADADRMAPEEQLDSKRHLDR